MLPDKDKHRLIRLLGMLGSDHDGEMFNAAKAIRRSIKEHKLCWEEMFNRSAHSLGAANRAAGGREGVEAAEIKRKIDAAFSAGFAAGVKAKMARPTWKQWAKDRISEDEDCLTDWEIKFFGDFGAGRYAVPTARQKAIFERVAARLGRELPGDLLDGVGDCPF